MTIPPIDRGQQHGELAAHASHREPWMLTKLDDGRQWCSNGIDRGFCPDDVGKPTPPAASPELTIGVIDCDGPGALFIHDRDDNIIAIVHPVTTSHATGVGLHDDKVQALFDTVSRHLTGAVVEEGGELDPIWDRVERGLIRNARKPQEHPNAND